MANPDQDSPFRVSPVTLGNDFVRLEPLRPHHAPALFLIGREPETWRYMPDPSFDNEVAAARWVTAALDAELAGTRVPFVIIRLSDQVIVGSTSLFDIRSPERAVEIGHTWLAPAACRTEVNTAAKLLLLTHCFERLGARRVQLKTDARNERSQRAIERLGATKEGVLRRHMMCDDGHQRDTVYYSILPEEWPPIRERLTNRLGPA